MQKITITTQFFLLKSKLFSLPSKMQPLKRIKVLRIEFISLLKIRIGYVLKSADVRTQVSSRYTENSFQTHLHTPMHTQLHPHTLAHTPAHTSMHTRAHPHTPVHTRTHPHTPAHTRTHLCIPRHSQAHPTPVYEPINDTYRIGANIAIFPANRFCRYGKSL